jgi:hypothetical protein
LIGWALAFQPKIISRGMHGMAASEGSQTA